jgi:sirohydrochlorin ferrochelatase
MKALLIVAHGSRKESSNEEIKELAAKVADSSPSDIECVKVAFLEMAAPSIEEAVDSCFRSGASELLVLPYFLAAGSHVTDDVPAVINAAMKQWPGRSCRVLPHIGAMDYMVNLVAGACKT